MSVHDSQLTIVQEQRLRMRLFQLKIIREDLEKYIVNLEEKILSKDEKIAQLNSRIKNKDKRILKLEKYIKVDMYN